MKLLPYGEGSGTKNRKIFALNPYTLRTPIWKGNLTKNDLVQLLPFADHFSIIENVPGDITQALLSWGLWTNPHPQQGGDPSAPEPGDEHVGDHPPSTPTPSTTPTPASSPASSPLSPRAQSRTAWQSFDLIREELASWSVKNDHPNRGVPFPPLSSTSTSTSSSSAAAAAITSPSTHIRSLFGSPTVPIVTHESRRCAYEQVCFYANIEQSAIVTDGTENYDIVVNGYDGETIAIILEREFPERVKSLGLKTKPFFSSCGPDLQTCLFSYVRQFMQPPNCGPYQYSKHEGPDK